MNLAHLQIFSSNQKYKAQLNIGKILKRNLVQTPPMLKLGASLQLKMSCCMKKPIPPQVFQ